MEREKRENTFINQRLVLARAIIAGLSVGIICLLVKGLENENSGGTFDTQPVTGLEKTEIPVLDDKMLLVLDHKEERITQPSLKLLPTPSPSPIEAHIELPQETASGNIDMSKKGPYFLSGSITYYGEDDGYGLDDTLGCTGQPFDPRDVETAARAYSSPFVCGDRVRVCDLDSCIEVIIRDSCPGCDSTGKLIDLSKGAMIALTGDASSTTATLEGPIQE